jgi:hypothetical protein
MLFNLSTTPYAEIYLNPFKAAAASLGVEAIVAPVHDMPEFRIRRCRTGPRAEWRPDHDAG